MPTFFPGGTPVLRVTCKTEAGALANPTTLAVVVYQPDGTPLQTYAIGDLTAESTGVYRCPSFTVPTAGWYRVKVTATGAVADVNWERFLVSAEPAS